MPQVEEDGGGLGAAILWNPQLTTVDCRVQMIDLSDLRTRDNTECVRATASTADFRQEAVLRTCLMGSPCGATAAPLKFANF